MSVASHEYVIEGPNGNRNYVLFTLTAHNSDTYQIRKLLINTTDLDTYALTLYDLAVASWEQLERDYAIDRLIQYLDPDYVTQHLAQADYDRFVLLELMQEIDPHRVNSAMTFWTNVQIRNGANASQRAASLGVALVEYQEVEDRMNAYIGVSSFLTADKAAVWTYIPEGWE